MKKRQPASCPMRNQEGSLEVLRGHFNVAVNDPLAGTRQDGG